MPAKTPLDPTGRFDPKRHIPTRTTASSGPSDALTLAERLSSVRVYFGDLDSTDTWQSPYGTGGAPDCNLRVQSFTFLPDNGIGGVRVALHPVTGVFTFTCAAADSTGTLSMKVA